MSNINKTANKLIGEKSPYLLQHAYNPVEWYPWGEEAFARAKSENKPIFLSIGYSTCHWCHVMEHESFEDNEAAVLLNRHFIPVKVDREERPDIDAVYMNVAQRINGSGGWPLTIIMTPEQKPFFAGTYLPKNSRYGMTGLMELLQTVADKWSTNKEELILSGNKITEIIRSLEKEKVGKKKLSKKTVLEAENLLEENFDEEYGGFSSRPKFPQPSYLLFLLSLYALEKDDDILYMVEKTLESMYKGGIFDHVGHGFSRYSTDEKWLVPHFEKMLYDNALLALAYTYAYEATGIELYRNVTEKVLDYVLLEMTDPQGGFYSAQDADSEGEEGKYYVYTPQEIIDILGKDDSSYFIDHYNISIEGNFEGKNIPNLLNNDDYFETDEKIEKLNKIVYEYRKTRTKLHKDDKILVSWNGMMAAAMASAFRVLGNERYLNAAIKSVDFIKSNLVDEENNVGVRYREGEVLGNGTLEDYSMLVWALIEMYQATFELNYLKLAVALNDKMIKLFWDDENGGFFLSSRTGERLIYNPKETYDGAVPSGNSVAAYNLMRLSRITGNKRIEELSRKQIDFLSSEIESYPAGHTFALLAVLYELYPSMEAVCLAIDEEDLNEVRKNLRHLPLVNTSVVAVKQSDVEENSKLINYLKDYKLKDNKPTYYICKNKNCSLPITDMDELLKIINEMT